MYNFAEFFYTISHAIYIITILLQIYIGGRSINNEQGHLFSILTILVSFNVLPVHSAKVPLISYKWLPVGRGGCGRSQWFTLIPVEHLIGLYAWPKHKLRPCSLTTFVSVVICQKRDCFHEVDKQKPEKLPTYSHPSRVPIHSSELAPIPPTRLSTVDNAVIAIKIDNKTTLQVTIVDADIEMKRKIDEERSEYKKFKAEVEEERMDLLKRMRDRQAWETIKANLKMACKYRVDRRKEAE